MDLEHVLQFLSDCGARGEPCVLVTVCAVEGSSMRNPGTIMGVAAGGSFAGSLSGGCIENAVVAEALDALKAGAARVVRFGAGSPYLDIKLPCGGGLDIHFQPLGDNGFARECLAAIRSHMPFSIRIGGVGARFLEGWCMPSFDGETGTFGHWPAPLLQIVGHGAGVEALARQATALGCEARVLTPDQRIIDQLDKAAIPAQRLTRTDQTGTLIGDPWTANIFLFHDHDWEDALMQRALELPHFYMGAMGGRKAHERRCDALRARGVSEAALATIHAPIGLFHSSRDPRTLALSTLAQVIRTYEETRFEAGFD